MNINTILDAIGTFSWSYSMKFFIETSFGNYIWHDPDYHGDNSFYRFNGGLKNFLQEEGIPVVRDKGQNKIRDFIGEDNVRSLKVIGNL